MALPSVSELSLSLGAAIGDRLRELRLTHAVLRELTERNDDLRTPLTPNREGSLRDDAQAVAVRLLFCREAISRSLALEVLSEALLAKATAEGLLIEEDGQLRSPFHLRTAAGLYLFSDYLGTDAEGVMGAGETTAVLYRAALPAGRVGQVLDLGCGAGTLALLFASVADRVIGTDINDRAVALSRWNAAVNAIPNASFRQGSLYEPVAGERFDLIVSQPPYYPNPQGELLTYLHGGRRGDELARTIVETAGDYLAPDGRAVVFASWADPLEPLNLNGVHALELTTNRRELHGTRQSITVVQPGPEMYSRFEVPADQWGDVESWRIDQLRKSQRLLQDPEETLLAARVSLLPGLAWSEEGNGLFLRGPDSSLIGLTPVNERERQILLAVSNANSIGEGLRRQPAEAREIVRHALSRGWLVVD